MYPEDKHHIYVLNPHIYSPFRIGEREPYLQSSNLILFSFYLFPVSLFVLLIMLGIFFSRVFATSHRFVRVRAEKGETSQRTRIQVSGKCKKAFPYTFCLPLFTHCDTVHHVNVYVFITFYVQ